MNLNIKSIEVKSESRQVRASWTRELATEISSYHSIDMSFEERLLRLLSRPTNRKESINKIFDSTKTS